MTVDYMHTHSSQPESVDLSEQLFAAVLHSGIICMSFTHFCRSMQSCRVNVDVDCIDVARCVDLSAFLHVMVDRYVFSANWKTSQCL